jgi:hypothetical protein
MDAGSTVDGRCRCRPPVLITGTHTLRQRLNMAAVESKTEFLVPGLQANGNMVTKPEGRYVPLFLSNPYVCTIVNVLLLSKARFWTWSVAGCLVMQVFRDMLPPTLRLFRSCRDW